MNSKDQDIKLAKAVCKEFKKGNFRLLEELYCRFTPFLKVVGQNRFRPEELEDIISEFWLQEVVEKNILCDYKGRGSLSGFLKQAFRFYFLSCLRTQYIINGHGSRNYGDPLNEGQPLARPTRCLSKKVIYLEDCLEDAVCHKDKIDIDEKQPTPEEILVEKEISAEGIVYLALDELSKISPQDAFLIALRLRAMPYEEIAKVLYPSENPHKIAVRVRKQFERAKKKLGIIINRLLEQRGLDKKDLFDR